MSLRFPNRRAAGEQLAEALAELNPPQPVVLALLRGGFLVAAPIAQRLRCPLDLVVAKKIAEPQHPELALGAVTPEGMPVWSHGLLQQLHLAPADLAESQQAARQLGQVQEQILRPFCPRQPLLGRSAILVDDGVATGMTLLAALRSVRARQPSQILIAVPVAPPQTLNFLAQQVDQAVALLQPRLFTSVGEYYEDFSQVSLAQIQALLGDSAQDLLTEA